MIGLGLLLLSSFTSIEGDGVRLDVDAQMRSRVVATLDSATPLGPFSDSETLLTSDGEVRSFALQSREESEVSDALGAGHSVVLTGRSGDLLKRVVHARSDRHDQNRGLSGNGRAERRQNNNSYQQ